MMAAWTEEDVKDHQRMKDEIVRLGQEKEALLLGLEALSDANIRLRNNAGRWCEEQINLREWAQAAIEESSNLALERAAKIADCWRCETVMDAPQNIRERTERQNKVAYEIAAAIRAEIGKGH